MHPFVIILADFVPTKIAPICNNNESHSASRSQRWFVGICFFQVLPVKICSLGLTLVEDLFLEKHLRTIFEKQWISDIPNH